MHTKCLTLSGPTRLARNGCELLKPNGILAVRDTAYNKVLAAATAALQQWLDVYQAIAIHSGSNPNIGLVQLV